jgi:transposase
MAAWKLTSDEWDAIDRFRFTTKDAREFRNALIILKSGAGASKREIAEDLGCSEATVQNIRRWYREEGIAGLRRESPPGRDSRADVKYREVLRKVLRTSPLDLRYGFSVWSTGRLGAHLEKVTGISFSVWQLRRIMKQEGFSVQRPKHTMRGKRDEAAFEQARGELEGLKKSRSARTPVKS